MRSHRVAITLIMLLYAVLASTYSALVPLGEGPDEPGHAKFVFFLAREGRLPVQCVAPCVGEVPGEGHQPPLAYVLMVPALLWMPPDKRDFDLPGNRQFVWLGGKEINAVGHGSREFWPWHNEVLAWHLARLINVFLGSLTVLFTYLAARLLAQQLDLRQELALFAALLVALNPQFLFTSALISNDSLLTMLCALMLWIILRGAAKRAHHSSKVLQHRAKSLASWRSGALELFGKALRASEVWIGLLLGLALLTKQSAFLLLPIVVLACVLPTGQGAWSLGKALLRSGTALLMAMLVAGWWYWRNWQLYGDALGASVFLAEFKTQAFEWRSLLAWRDALLLLHESFWARFGWMNVPVPAAVIWLYTAIELLGLWGLIRLLRSCLQRDAQLSIAHGTTVNSCDTGVLMPHTRSLASWRRGGLVLFRQALGHYRQRSQSTRLASIVYCLAPLFAFPLLSFAWVTSFALSAGLVAWQGRLMFPALPAIAILLGLGLAGASRKQSGCRNTQVSLVETQYLASAGGDVGSPNISGFMFKIQYILMVLFAAWLPFGVILAAYPPQTLPEAVALSRIAQPFDVRFAARYDERGAELRSVNFEQLARPGDKLTVTLLWHALGRQNRRWWIFVHLVDAQDTILAEANGEPRQGAFRMSLWSNGDWIEDQHTLALPADLPPGSYTLRIGLWDVNSGKRAGVFDRRNKLIGDFVEPGTVVVTSGE